MAAHEKITYEERQLPRVSSFIPLVMFIPAVWIVGAPFGTWVGAIIGTGLAILGAALKLGAAQKILVTEQFLQLGKAVIPLQALGNVETVTKDDQFFERGAKLDARAFVFLKYGLPGMVKVEVTDPKDPTPYLLISTRNPQALLQALS